MRATRREIERHSKVDAEAYDEFAQAMVSMCRFVKPILAMVPPDPTSFDPRDWKKLASLAKRFQALPAEDKIQPRAADDHERRGFSGSVVRDGHFESHHVVFGNHRDVSRHPFARHGLRPAASLHGRNRWRVPLVGIQPRRHGRDIECHRRARRARRAPRFACEAPVAQILVKDGAARGVALESGEEIHAGSVSSSVDPNLTFLKFIEARDLPGDFLEEVRRYKFRGSSGKVNLALDGLPDFTCLPGPGRHLRGAISISPSTEYLERAYDQAKYGEFSRRPYIDMVIPSLTDPSVAPPGKHVLSCFVQYAPYKLARRDMGRPARGVWQHRDRHDFRIRAEPEKHHHRQAGSHAAGYRAPDRA